MKNIILLAALLAPLVAAADPLPKPVEGMECLIGTWKGAGTVSMGKDKAKIDATWTCNRVSAKWGVMCTFHVDRDPGCGRVRGDRPHGLRPEHEHVPLVRGHQRRRDPRPRRAGQRRQQAQFIYSGTQDGKPVKEVIDLELTKDSKQATGRAETFVGGASASVLEVRS